MIRTFLVAFAVTAAASASAVAAEGISVSQDKHMVIAPAHGTTDMKPNKIHKAKAATIFSNLATAYPNGIYFSGEGATLCGPDCGIGESIAVAGGFTPTATATATEIDAAVGYIEGTDEITFSIYSDDSGAPGTALWSGNAKSLPTFGACCGLTTAKIKDGLSLTAGKPYWVVVSTNAKETTTFAAWNVATTNQITAAPAAYNINSAGWRSSTTVLPPAFAVYSK